MLGIPSPRHYVLLQAGVVQGMHRKSCLHLRRRRSMGRVYFPHLVAFVSVEGSCI